MNDVDAGDLMQFAVERFYRDCALFGTVDQCVERVLRLKEAGVDEIACLLDFGVGAEEVMASLRLLGEVRDRVLDKLTASRETRRHG